ncbi:helix-turn-helix domain-containing protein [Peptococcaceae bacterium]|nr:helix-turn-helix domain-containing protein [Peptococcaceae bacterium]
MDISKRIKDLRRKFGLSQGELARRAKVPQSGISFIESGDKSPSIKTITLICKGLGITLKEFFDFDNTNINNSAPELQQLIDTAKTLSPKQLKQLNEFLKTLKEE